MKKRYLNYFLVLAFVLLTAVLLSPDVSAQEVTITINIVGLGSVDRGQVPPYSIGDKFFLEAKPDPGYQFDNWSDTLGGISGSVNPIELTVSGNHVITATFSPVAATCFSLTTAVPGGGGSIDRSRPGDDGCPAGQYLKDSPVLLTASPNPGYDFTRWTVLPEGTQPETSPIEITMNQNRSVSAEFVKACRQLSLSRSPLEGGAPLLAVPTESAGCGESFYKVGEPISLTATPTAGWKTAGWIKRIGTDTDTIPPLPSPNENNYIFSMPGLTNEQSLSVEVNYKEKATFGFASATQSVFENAGEINILIVWDENTLPAASTVRFETVDSSAKAGKDYIAKSSTRSFEAGETRKNIAIQIKEDKISEGDESFFIDLTIVGDNSDAKLGTSRIEVTILDDDTGIPTIRFEDPPYEVAESLTSIDVAVTVYPIPMNVNEVFVDFYTEDDTATAGEDYSAYPKNDPRTIRIPITDEQARATVKINLFPDDLNEADETVRLLLTSPSSSGDVVLAEDPTVAILTIIDDDDPPVVGFGADEYSIKIPDNTVASIPVNLSDASGLDVLSGQEVKVDYTVTLERTGSSTEGTLSIDAGMTTTNLEVSVASTVAGDVFTLQLSNPQNAELGSLNAARLYVLDTDNEDCHKLTLTKNGYGEKEPAATNIANSLGCPIGEYVTGELIEITAQPDPGWYVASWHGTIDDESSSLQNAVEMPDQDLIVTAEYRIPIFFAVVNRAQDPFNGPNEEEPNNLFSQANGPLQFNKSYRGNFSSDDDNEDRFYFLVGKKSDITITLKDIPQDRDYDLYLYPEDWTNGDIAASREYDNQPEEINITLDPGLYYVRILAGGSESTNEKYNLRIEAE